MVSTNIKGSKCKNCETKYHVCSSCDVWDMPWLHGGYCSRECWKTSHEYGNIKNAFISFYSSLEVKSKLGEESQEEQFDFLLENLFFESAYEFEIEEWLKEGD